MYGSAFLARLFCVTMMLAKRPELIAFMNDLFFLGACDNGDGGCKFPSVLPPTTPSQVYPDQDFPDHGFDFDPNSPYNNTNPNTLTGLYVYTSVVVVWRYCVAILYCCVAVLCCIAVVLRLV